MKAKLSYHGCKQTSAWSRSLHSGLKRACQQVVPGKKQIAREECINARFKVNKVKLCIIYHRLQINFLKGNSKNVFAFRIDIGGSVSVFQPENMLVKLI